jgi:V-type H+-transporting ATPase subunit a
MPHPPFPPPLSLPLLKTPLKLRNTRYTGADLCAAGKDGLSLGGESNGCQPPNLITTLINIALAPGTCVQPMFEGQAGLQLAILLVAFLSVPILLFGKPCAIAAASKQKHGDEGTSLNNGDNDDGESGGGGEGHGGGGGGGDHGDDSFTEIVIHQAIETIEFVLGMVSNTASYLRLWALSLAHTELASVFWEKAMLVTIQSKSAVLIFMGYGVFAAVTFAVLLCMDVLECFLHALRLHWVEFQNKFYKADGYPFKPFALEPILRAAV